MNLSHLSSGELARALAGPGLPLRTGQFTTRIRTRIPGAVEAIGTLYADHPLAPEDGFSDFHVRLLRPAGLRRWYHPQVLFAFDDFIPFKPLPYDHAFPMLEWGLNWCVTSHAHWYLILHAAVVEKNGFAAILPAPPGSGKSTLCAALVNRGWRLLSDELTLIDPHSGRIDALARPVSLKNASIDIIRSFAPDAVFGPLARDTAKGTVAHMKPSADSVARAQEPAAPRWVIFPKYAPGSPPLLAPHPKGHALLQFAENAFNYSVLGALGYEALARLIAQCDCFDFTYSRLDDAIATFNDLAASSHAG